MKLSSRLSLSCIVRNLRLANVPTLKEMRTPAKGRRSESNAGWADFSMSALLMSRTWENRETGHRAQTVIERYWKFIPTEISASRTRRWQISREVPRANEIRSRRRSFFR